MSQNTEKSFDLKRSENDYEEEYDFITFQYDSQQINLYYSHIVKYSQLIRKKYVYSDVQNILPEELHTFQKQNDIILDNIFLFFQLLEKDFAINDALTLTYKQYIDLYKISEFLQINKLAAKLDYYFNSHKSDVDFIFQIILHEVSNSKNTENQQFQFNKKMETVLSSKINECLQNDKFLKMPIYIIYRIIEKCDMKKISQDLLYDYIKKNFPKNYVLFYFLNIQDLSDEKIKDLYEFYTNANESQKSYFGYLKCNLDYIAKLKESSQNESNFLRSQIGELQNSFQNLQNEHQNLKNHSQKVEQERDDLIKNEKAYFDSIRHLIPYKNDNERVSIVESDVHFSDDVRSMFSNSPDNEILGFISKDIKLASSVRGLFKSGDDSWIRNQIEGNLNQIPDFEEKIANLQNVINRLENEKSNLQSRLDQTENEKSNLQSRLDQTENEKSNLQSRLDQTENEKSNLQSRLNQTENEKNNFQSHINQIEKKNCDLQKTVENMKRLKGSKYITSIIVGGSNDYNQFGLNPKIKSKYGVPIITPPLNSPVEPSSVLSFSVYGSHSVLIMNDGSLKGAGYNKDGRISASLGKDIFSQFTNFNIKDRNGHKLVAVSAVCTQCNTLYMFKKSGSNGRQLVLCDKDINYGTPIFIDIGNHEPVSLFGGIYHAAAIGAEGEVIFINRISIKNSPSSPIEAVYLPEGQKASSVACCRSSVLVLSSNGRVFESRFKNEKGSVLIFSAVNELADKEIICLSGTSDHCFAVSKDGRVFGRGSNKCGQLGYGQKIESSFTEISSLRGYKIRAAYAGRYHSLFETQEGKILACGSNSLGALLLRNGPDDQNVHSPTETMITENSAFCIAGNHLSTVFIENLKITSMPNMRISD